jgi:amino acid transporter
MESHQLKKENLGIFETLALSVAMMGPSVSISITIIQMALCTGYSAPLVFLLSTGAVGLVSVSIVKLNQYFPSSGSVFYFAEKTLNRKAGFLAGWLIVLTYLMLGVSCVAIAASNLQTLLAVFGIRIHWEFIIPVIMAVVWYLAGRNAKTSARLLLILEVLSISIILVLCVTILIKTAAAKGLSAVPFEPGKNSFSSIATATVFGFLSFSGFEGASSLGEESKNPKKTIPLAVAGSIIISGIFYIVVSYAQILGFGLTSKGLAALSGSALPLADLMSKYLSPVLSLTITFCISLSFFSVSLGCVNSGARILYTMGKDGMLSGALYKTNPRHHTPSAGINLMVGASVLIFAACFWTTALDIGRYTATIGSLTILLSYLLATICAIVFFHRNKIWKGVRLIIPLVTVFILVVIFFLNIYPIPEYPYNLIIVGIFIWLVVGLLLSIRIKNSVQE